MSNTSVYLTNEGFLEIEEELIIPDEDIEMVANQANVSEDEAKAALEDTNGDLAEAILKLNQ